MLRQRSVSAVLMTSMHSVAYYGEFLYCAFGRRYGCLVTQDRCVTLSANIDYGQPWRRCYGEKVVYADWRRDNFWSAVQSIASDANAKSVEIEGDHLTLLQCSKL